MGVTPKRKGGIYKVCLRGSTCPVFGKVTKISKNAFCVVIHSYLESPNYIINNLGTSFQHLSILNSLSKSVGQKN